MAATSSNIGRDLRFDSLRGLMLVIMTINHLPSLLSRFTDEPLGFPGVTRAQVYECLAYYEDHRAEIDDLVAGQMHDPRA